ncbi:expansin-A10-like [Iris pallida]|uniref:Expansin-A10-like n=1 Tax=Iris pallida TaxID=29817 RepID=A0AAX6EAR2_IRIPA|nr:expansin-A10-like [Iris pallida]
MNDERLSPPIYAPLPFSILTTHTLSLSQVSTLSLPQRKQQESNHVLSDRPLLPRRLLAVASKCARPRPRGRRRRRRRVVRRPRHLLRGRRRLGHDGRRVRLREPVQPGVRDQHRGAEHGAVQRRAELRVVLRDPVRRGPQVVRRGLLRRRHRHQLLPAQQCAPQQRRRLVQPSPAALRPLPARLPAHCSVQGRHCPRCFQKGGVQEEGRDQVHNQRPLVLQPRPGEQRGRRGGRARRVGEGLADGVAGHVQELGPELAEQRLPQRPGPLLQGHHQRRQDRALQQRRPRRLVLRPDLLRSSVLALL